MKHYETGTMRRSVAAQFESEFDARVGTELDINHTDQGVYFVACELTDREVDICRQIENSL